MGGYIGGGVWGGERGGERRGKKGETFSFSFKFSCLVNLCYFSLNLPLCPKSCNEPGELGVILRERGAFPLV